MQRKESDSTMIHSHTRKRANVGSIPRELLLAYQLPLAVAMQRGAKAMSKRDEINRSTLAGPDTIMVASACVS